MKELNLGNIIDYKDAIEYFADYKINNVLSNSGNEYAIVIFDNIFKTAERNICLYAQDIFSNKNDVTVSSSYIESLQKFLSKEGTNLRIVLKDYDEINSCNHLRDILKQYSSRIELRKNRKGEVKIGENRVYFCIADGRMYRVEYDTNTRKARCNFNDNNAVSKYQTVFNQLFEASTPTYL